MDENIYMMGGVRSEDIETYRRRKSQLVATQPEPLQPTLRAATRKKDKEPADQVANLQNVKRDQERKKRKLTRKEVRAENEQREAESKRKVQERHQAQEKLMQLQNQKANGQHKVDDTDDIPAHALITDGILAIKGKTGVRLFDANNTIIYVKNGDSIQQAVERFLINRTIAVHF